MISNFLKQMKKVFLLTFLGLACVFGNEKSTMYFDVTPGASYVSFLEKKHDFEERLFFEGFGPSINMKLGGAGQIFALYFELQLMKSYGDLEIKNFSHPASVTRSMFGFGMSFHPWRNPESIMHGSFFGFSLGCMSEQIIFSDIVVSEDQGVSFGIEFGKLWRINDKWSFGFSFLGTKDASIRYGEGSYDYHFFTAQLGIKFLRR